MEITDLWTSPAQCAVMAFLCWKDREHSGYAEPSVREVMKFAGIKTARHVRLVYGELEALEAIERLGATHGGGRQRIVVTLDRALLKKARGVIPSSPPPDPQIIPHPDLQIIPPLRTDQGGVIPSSPPVPAVLKKEGTDQKYKAREAAPRLPLLGALPPDHPPAVVKALKAAADHRRARLRSRVAGLARAILFNPTFAQALVGEAIDDNIGALVEATKAVCGAKRVDGYAEVVHGVCVSELFKFRNPDVIRGQAPRPRDRARRPR